MEQFTRLTLLITEDCNFDCAYCLQKKSRNALDFPTISRAIDFFSRFFSHNAHINFTGGEPLLAFDLITYAVERLENHNPALNLHYSITTNGSLINSDILDFFSQHSFTVDVSFDGLAQETTRKPGTFKAVTGAIKTLAAIPSISLRANYVLIPETVSNLAGSITYTAELGVHDIFLSFSTNHPWDESALRRLRQELSSLHPFLTKTYRESGGIPFGSFRNDSQTGIFSCNGGSQRMALDQDGLLWGCYLFAEYFKGKEGSRQFEKYCFGQLDEFIMDYKKIWTEKAAHYSSLRQYTCSTSKQHCSFCNDLENCRICPVSAAFASSIIGRIPDWRCDLMRIVREERDIFLKEIGILPAD